MNVTTVANPTIRVDLTDKEVRDILCWMDMARSNFALCSLGTDLYNKLAMAVGKPTLTRGYQK